MSASAAGGVKVSEMAFRMSGQEAQLGAYEAVDGYEACSLEELMPEHGAAASWHEAAHNNSRQHEAAYNSNREHEAAHNNSRQHEAKHDAAYSSTRQHKATHANSKEHAPAYSNNIQHEAAHNSDRRLAEEVQPNVQVSKN